MAVDTNNIKKIEGLKLDPQVIESFKGISVDMENISRNVIKPMTQAQKSITELVKTVISPVREVIEEIKKNFDVDNEEFKEALEFLVVKRGYVLPLLSFPRSYIDVYNQFKEVDETEMDKKYEELFWDGEEGLDTLFFYEGTEGLFEDGWSDFFRKTFKVVEELGLEYSCPIIIYSYYALLENVIYSKSERFRPKPNKKGETPRWSATIAIRKMIADIESKGIDRDRDTEFILTILKGIESYSLQEFNRDTFSSDTNFGRHSLLHGAVNPKDITVADFFRILNLLTIFAYIEEPKDENDTWSLG